MNYNREFNMDNYTITVSFDDETLRWYAINDDIPLVLEDGSLDALICRVKIAALEVLEANNKPHTGVSLVYKIEAQAVMA